MPAPSPQNPNRYAIRKSQSVGGFSPALNNSKNKVKNKEAKTLSSKFQRDNDTINETETENEATPVASPEATPITGRKKAGSGGSSSKKLGNLFKWFRNDSNNQQQSTNNKQAENEDLYAKIKKNQALKVLERSIFSNGTDVSQSPSGLKRNESVESICSVGSTASFSYVPISNKNKHPSKNKHNQHQNKIIPLGNAESVIKCHEVYM